MTNRYGQSIRHIWRFRQAIKPQFALDGRLHLLLVRPAVARENPFDLRGRIMHHRNARYAAARQITPRACPIKIDVRG